MTASFLLGLFDSAYLLALAALVGGIACFLFVLEPIALSVLGADSAARLICGLAPRFYLWNAILASIALPAFVAGPLCYPEYRGLAVGVQSMILLAIILIMLHGANVTVSALNRSREVDNGSLDRFDRLHRLSVIRNSAAMIAGAGLLIAFACRPVPRTRGIIELTPTERAQREAETGRGVTPAPKVDSSPNAGASAGLLRSGGP